MQFESPFVCARCSDRCAGHCRARRAAGATKVTTPEAFFGHQIGADYVLPNYTKFTEFVRKLDAESDRMTVQSIGKTAEGRDQLMAIITSPENHKNLQKYKDIARRLALAEGLTDEQARQLARDGKAVVWIDGGLHATEVLGAQQLMETIYQLVSRTDEETMRFLRDVIILAVHANPDGMELVSDWYMRHKDQKHAHDRRHPAPLPEVHRPRQQPRLLHVGAARIDQHEPPALSRVVPADHVQPPSDGTDGHDSLRAAIPRSCQLRLSPAHHHRPRRRRRGDAQPLRRRKQAGRDDAARRELLDVVERRAADDGVFPQHDRPAHREHRQSRRRCEVAFVPDRQIASADLPFPIKPQAWHFRQSIEYSITANRAVLDVASRNKEHFLYNIYKMGKDSIETAARQLDDVSRSGFRR